MIFYCYTRHGFWTLNQGILTNISADYAYTSRSGVNSKCDLIVGRPSGGVAILWHKSLSKCVKPVVINNNRLCAIEVLSANQRKILIMCCYLPCDSGRINDIGHNFLKCLDAVQMFMAKCDYDEILLGWGLNVDLKRNAGNCKYLKQFCSICELEFAWNHLNAQPGVTYESYDGSSSSIIDHFLVSNYVWHNIRNVTVIDNVRNMSNHNPIIINWDLSVHRLQQVDVNCVKTGVSWDKVAESDTELYLF